MFTIDLLKGKGIPIKRRPWGAAIAALAFVVPIVVAAVMFGFFLSNRIVIEVARQEISNYEKNIATLSDVVEMQKAFETEKNNINSCLSEASSYLSKYAPWSPVLAVIAENIPDSMILTKLEMKQKIVKKSVPKKDNPKQTENVDAYARTLDMAITGRTQASSGKEVQNFKDRLRHSALLARELEEINVSQQPATLDGQDVVSYDISCVFKPKY
jgi:Tfp pilus assembly protein PilN